MPYGLNKVAPILWPEVSTRKQDRNAKRRTQNIEQECGRESKITLLSDADTQYIQGPSIPNSDIVSLVCVSCSLIEGSQSMFHSA